MDKNIPLIIGVTTYQITGIRIKSYIAAISRDIRKLRFTVSLCPIRFQSNASGLPRLPFMDECFRSVIGIVTNKVSSPRMKRDIPSIT